MSTREPAATRAAVAVELTAGAALCRLSRSLLARLMHALLDGEATGVDR